MRGLRAWIQRLLGQRASRRVLAGAAGAACALLSVTVQAAGGEAAADGAHHVPHVNWWVWDQKAPPVGWFWLDFLLFVAILVFFLKGPLRKLFEKRTADIRQAIDDAQAAHRQAEAHRDDYRDKVERVDEEVSALVDGAEKDGKTIRDGIVDAAKNYVEHLRKDSGAAAAQEAQAAHLRLQNEVVAGVMNEATTMLEAELGDSDQQRLLERAIEALEDADEPILTVRASTQLSAGGAP